MGLDQYAYSRPKKTSKKVEPTELMYWRKHNRLQGWMENLWDEKSNDPEKDVFNCVELVLKPEDIDALEEAIKNKELPATGGFFFGGDSYEDYENEEWGYKKQDEEFIEKAREAHKAGLEVFYYCWW